MTTGREHLDDKSLGQLISDLTSQVGDLVSTEVQLAKSEITEEVKKAGRAGGMIGAAAVLGYLSLLLLMFAVAWGIADLLDIPVGWGFLIVAALAGVAAAVLFSRGKKEMEAVDPVPDRTVQTLKEDAEWIRDRSS